MGLKGLCHSKLQMLPAQTMKKGRAQERSHSLNVLEERGPEFSVHRSDQKWFVFCRYHNHRNDCDVGHSPKEVPM